MSFEHLFASSVLNVVVPDTSIEYPPQSPSDNWLARLQSSSVERKQAFFDEQLRSTLILHVEHPTPSSPADPHHPPQTLLTFLAYVQISLEATYISSEPATTQDSVRTARLSAPLRPSLPLNSQRLQPHHPSIFPPSTPHPTPSSSEHDRRYVASEGTLLLAHIWGQEPTNSQETFSLLWSDKEQRWVAVYQLSLTISFLRLDMTDPLLCLTVSATLREKPVPLTQPKHPLRLFFASVGQPLTDPESPTTIEGTPVRVEEDMLDGLEEANLLTGLLGGPVFSDSSSSKLSLPSTRIGTASRQNLFSLPPVRLPAPPTPSPSPMTAVRIAHPTLRKSFRRTLKTVSGFRVRMRTVFVPYVLLPETQVSMDPDETLDERERREAGNEERTVVLCVEVENSGESGLGIGFLVEKVDVKIGGEGAKATLIGWGEEAFRRDAELTTFPLQVGAMAQCNLLYAVSFLRPPEEVEGLSLYRDLQNQSNSSASELQRPVTINIYGKPYLQDGFDLNCGDQARASYPTQTFASRWNCVLDLSTHQRQPLDQLEDLPGGHHVLPEPASPFPATATPRLHSPYSSTPQSSMTAGSKRHTLPVSFNSQYPKTPTPERFSTPTLNISHRDREQSPFAGLPSRMTYTPPSITAQIARSPTTYAPPDSAQVYGLPNLPQHDQNPSQTPAYPAYPPFPGPPATMSQGPIASHTSGNVGLAVELPRERGAGTGKGAVSTPGPWITGAFVEQKMLTQLQNAEESGEAIVISVGLLPVETRHNQGGEAILGLGKIYPKDRFTLDIFVFNQSTWTRRFEITCPDRRRRHKSEGSRSDDTPDLAKVGLVGILPMDFRVRIGPLRPSACQSVRMEFLALTPGVHSIDALTLTDIESGLSMNLRSVMDVVVHDTDD